MTRFSLVVSTLIVAVTSTLGATAALAQEGDVDEGQGSAPPKIQLAVPPAPAPAIERKFHVHRGLYAAIQAGVGVLGSDVDNGDPGFSQDISGSGFNIALDALIGYGVSPGFALGGALFNDFLLSAEFERPGENFGDENARATMLGVFADGFPDSRGGWRLGGSVGLAQISVNNLATNGDAISEFGLGLAGWLGYAAWVGDEFAIGPTLRVMATFDPSGDVSANTRSLSLMWTGIYF